MEPKTIQRKTISNEMIFSLIGLAIMLLGFVLPGIGPITDVGMRVVFIFIGALFLWSTVNAIWPSLVAVFLFGLCGYYGAGAEGLIPTMTTVYGDETFIQVMMMFVFFGAVKESGAMSYVARWILSRKVLNGHPGLLVGAIGATAYLMSFATNAQSSIMIMWSILGEICLMIGLKHYEDSLWTYIWGAAFLGAGLGHCAMPYKTTGLAMLRVYEKVTEGKYPINGITYLVFSAIMAVVMIAALVVLMRIFKTDTSKMKNLSMAEINQRNPLPPMSRIQKLYLVALPLFIIVLLLPSIGALKNLAPIAWLDTIGTLGVTVAFVIILGILRIDGKSALDFHKIAKNNMIWKVLFLMIAAKHVGSALADGELGVVAAIKDALNPVLGGKPEIVFVFLILQAAMILTNVGNNVSMSIALTPVVLAFAGDYGISPAPVVINIMMIVFASALLTPAASTPCAMCYGSPDYSPKEIRKYGIPLAIFAVFAYTFIGYPLAKLLIG